MTSINFVLRPSVNEGRHAGSLSLRVIHNRKSRMVVTGCRLYPEEWDAENQKILYPVSDHDRTASLADAETKITAATTLLESIVASLDKQGRYTVGDMGEEKHSENLRPQNGGKQPCGAVKVHQYLIDHFDIDTPCYHLFVAKPINVQHDK